jgi:paired amphipathic helix protein Sin3a
LQHQGITFKAQDKRYISSKSLVSEIESQRRTELQKKIALPMRLRPPAPTYQFAYTIEDENVLFDSLKLFLSYLDRAPGNHTMAERDRIEAFLRSLTSLVFAIPVSVLDSMLTPVQDAALSESVSEVGEADAGSESAASSADLDARRQSGSLAPGQAAAAKKAEDLRKKVMMGSRTADSTKGGATDGEQTPASSRASTPALLHPSDDTTMLESDATVAADVVMEDSNVEKSAKSPQDNASQGDSTFKKDVPTSAAGLEGMQGVETVQVDKNQAHVLGAQTMEQRNTPAGQAIQVESAGNSAMQDSPGLSSGNSARNDQQSGTPVIQPALPHGQPQLRRFNFFCNTPYYIAIRLLHVGSPRELSFSFSADMSL